MTDPFHRTNINLNAADVTYLRKVFGFGWSERVRECVASFVRDMKLRDRVTVHTTPKGEISRRYIDNTEVPNDQD